MKFIRGIKKVSRNFLKYLRYGGVTVANICQVSYPETLNGKRVLVTGGSSGIGLAIAEKFHSMGAIVLIVGRNKERLNDVVAKYDKNMLYREWDISSQEGFAENFSEILNELGGLDIVINNAGIYTTKTYDDMISDEWNRVIDTNLRAAYFVMKYSAEYFITKKVSGKIINIDSNRGFMGDTGPYGASKWGLRGLTYGFAKELIQYGIKVNGIAPGTTATGINNINPFDNIYDEREANFRVVCPEEIAEIAAFLVSGAAESIVGEIIVCDGGSSLK